MSCFTGIAYHLVAYGNRGNISSFVQVGLLAASIFAISNLFRREYRLPNFFSTSSSIRGRRANSEKRTLQKEFFKKNSEKSTSPKRCANRHRPA
jgi:hypothetical protein